jgi:hypothetical protein
MAQELNEYKIEESKEDIQEIKGTVEKIFKILEGPDGLVVKTSLNTASLKRAWWFIAAMATLILGVAIKAGFASLY